MTSRPRTLWASSGPSTMMTATAATSSVVTDVAAGPSSALIGDAVRDLILHAVEENAFSAAGMDLCRSRETARLLHPHSRYMNANGNNSSVGDCGESSHRTPTECALALVASALHERRDRVVAQVLDIVERMRLTCSRNVSYGIGNATRAQAGSPAAPGAQDAPAPAPISVRNEPASSPSEAPVLPPAATTTTASTPAPAVSAPAPTSALARLVAAAKRKHQGEEAGEVRGKAGPEIGEAAGHKRRRPGGSEDGAGGGTPGAHTTSHTAGPSRGSHNAHTRAEEEDDDDDEDFAVRLPFGTIAASAISTKAASRADGNDGAATAGAVADTTATAVKHPSQMTREEFLRQFKRAPRRGEVGQSAEEIAKAQQLGYVMSGSRSIGAQMYVDRVQRQLHEREASKLQQQFRKVEDERMDNQMIQGMLKTIEQKTKTWAK